MARTVTSELERRRRGESGGEQKGDKGVEEEGVVEKNFMWEGGDGGENFVGLEEEEEEEALGRGKRRRKGTSTFQFCGEHVLFSQTSAKHKQKIVTEERSKEKQMRYYKKKHHSDLKNQMKALKAVNKKLASELKAKSRQIKKLTTKQ